MRVGEGFDIHRLVKGRKLILGGIELPSDVGEEAISDGDVLLHAIIDAMFGAVASGDIGTHFPEGEEYLGASSADLLGKAIEECHVRIINLDCNIFLERPKLAPYREKIRDNLSVLLSMPKESISIKAKTMEGLGAIGDGKAIAATAVILAEEKEKKK